jgi:hypothetical protein
LTSAPTPTIKIILTIYAIFVQSNAPPVLILLYVSPATTTTICIQGDASQAAPRSLPSLTLIPIEFAARLCNAPRVTTL